MVAVIVDHAHTAASTTFAGRPLSTDAALAEIDAAIARVGADGRIPQVSCRHRE
ncbi:hypothetical protein OG884_16225 [Streptosporangium sp. NBC_01755]|uniref:hypothetical protein n=1 Tax=unclassified Streptosporangium TaxID=2632669 RepID=UPI002DDC1A2D|nr:MULTISPECIES: hypothetical protein [unclassified Streptosporangium]WSA25308.1 hypothetical protein OIE13_31005 [Streptosporangium sp. NBC_01810]WSD03375.1 hypothetical protein OG884_16225 [Streptosporangium sp. NBC_01755]